MFQQPAMLKTVCLLVVVSSALDPRECFDGDLNENSCCFPLSSGGDQRCFDSVFTHQFCCGHLTQQLPAIAENCWDADFTEDRCCYPLESKGNDLCFDQTFSHEYCCGHLIGAKRRVTSPAEMCWFGPLTEQSCCYPLEGDARGNPICFTEDITHEFCCGHLMEQNPKQSIEKNAVPSVPEKQMKKNKNFSEPSPECWNGWMTEDECCYPLIESSGGARGQPACFDHKFTHDYCCGHIIRESSAMGGCWQSVVPGRRATLYKFFKIESQSLKLCGGMIFFIVK